ncbi:unnamed protein product [Clonostachys rhizophaga]|uniref:Uncharacterized protein n=1 Tax=Clonostachys rhizophaga TaxID=160324 RepID=A0A9N9VWQ7_9HYPO|nr:unnamed protein product [Clonostachys rhizophaga]
MPYSQVLTLAAVQLSEKAITDRLTRVLVFLSAAAGMLYKALWYFPLLMLIAGCTAVVYDFRWLHGPVERIVGIIKGEGPLWLAEDKFDNLAPASITVMPLVFVGNAYTYPSQHYMTPTGVVDTHNMEDDQSQGLAGLEQYEDGYPLVCNTGTSHDLIKSIEGSQMEDFTLQDHDEWG